MDTPDVVNGLFEFISGLLFLLNIRIILRDKAVQGVSLIPTAFFTTWGFWNLYYYSHLEQWFSFYGGIFLVSTNALWLSLALYYRNRKPRSCDNCMYRERLKCIHKDNNMVLTSDTKVCDKWEHE